MKEINPKHTFVICAYKESPYLELCIQSLIKQDSVKSKISQIFLYTSTPNQFTKDLAQKYHLELFEGKSKGIGANWNEALSCATTKYATIAHQDDIYESTYGTKIIQAFESDEALNIVFSDYYEVDGLNAERPRNLNLKIKTAALRLLSLNENKAYQRRVYAFGNFICCPAVSYNCERLGDFRFDENLRMAVDWDAWERIMKMPGKIKYLPQRLMAHRIHEESETTANTLDKNRENEERAMFQRYWGQGMTELLMKFYVKNQKSNF